MRSLCILEDRWATAMLCLTTNSMMQSNSLPIWATVSLFSSERRSNTCDRENNMYSRIRAACRTFTLCSRSVCWPTKRFLQNSLFIFTPCLLATSLLSHSMGSNCQSLERFTLVPLLFGTTSHCLSVQPFQLLPSRNIWRRHLFDMAHRHHHTQWPVNVMELLHQLCCWTPIWLSCHWAWLFQGYWRYRNLNAWLTLPTFQVWQSFPTCTVSEMVSRSFHNLLLTILFISVSEWWAFHTIMKCWSQILHLTNFSRFAVLSYLHCLEMVSREP